jgi:hypothetical protein
MLILIGNLSLFGRCSKKEGKLFPGILRKYGNIEYITVDSKLSGET